MSTQHRHTSRIPRPSRWSRAVRVIGRFLRGLLALSALGILIVGIPWALVHYIGWPFPDHVPTWDELRTALLSPMSTQFLLDTLACILWPTWAIFTCDVAICVGEAIRFSPVLPRRAGPLRTVAGVLVGAIVMSVLSQRAPAAGTNSSPTLSYQQSTPVAVTAAWGPGPLARAPVVNQSVQQLVTAAAPAGAAVVQPPHDGIYDSLWRIADRELGNGARWTEIWELNEDYPQADGRSLTNPNLLRPGWILRLPAPPSPPGPPTSQENGHTNGSGDPATATRAQSTPATQPPTTSPAPGTPTTPRTPRAHGARLPAPHPGTSIAASTGAFVGLGLTSLITATLITLRLRRRRDYIPGSGQRFDENIAPIVRSLRVAYDMAALQQDEDGTPIYPEHRPGSADAQVAVRDRARTTADTIHPADSTTVVGVRESQAVAVDLARTQGLGLSGPGAASAIRALIVTLLAEAQRNDPDDVQVVIPSSDLATLLGEDSTLHSAPRRLTVIEDLEAALDILETELLARTRSDHAPPGVLILVATPAQHLERRLQAVLDNGSSLGLAGVLIGGWRPGGTIRVRPDGTVSATSPNLDDTLTGTRLFTLPARDAADLVDLLGRADEGNPHGPHSGATHTNPPDDGDHPSTETDTHGEAARPVLTPSIHVDIPPLAHDSPPNDADSLPHPKDSPDPETLQETAPAPQALSDAEAVFPPDDTERALALSVLGSLQLCHRGTGQQANVIDGLAPKQREILVHLALEPDGSRRDVLTAAIWPNASGKRPYNSFHATLSQLRRAVHATTGDLGADLVVIRDNYYILNHDLVTVDLWRLKAALRAQRHASDDSRRCEILHKAVDLYKGDLAEDLGAVWLDGPRESLRRDVLDAISTFIHTINDNQPAQKLAALEQARRLDPHNEAIYRKIVTTQAQLGQHDSIPRTQALLTKTLAEMGDSPSHEFIALCDSLTRQATPPVAHEK